DALLAEGGDQQHEPPPRAASSGTALRQSDPRAEQGKPRSAHAPQAPPVADPSGAADHLRRLEGQLGDIMARLPARNDAELATAIREISARQRQIDEHADAAGMRRDQRALGEAVAALHGEVNALNVRVAAIGRSGEDVSAVASLAQRIDALAADRSLD